MARVRELGLPVSDGHVFAPVDFETETFSAGLDVSDHPTTDDIQARYFAGGTDDLAAFTFEPYLTATVPG